MEIAAPIGYKLTRPGCVFFAHWGGDRLFPPWRLQLAEQEETAVIDGEKGLRAVSAISSRRSPVNPTPIRPRHALTAAVRPLAESLEPRRLLSTAVWTGAAGDSNWATAANWTGGSGAGGVPGAGDDVSIGAGFATINIPIITPNMDSINSASPLQVINGILNVGGGTASSSLSDGLTLGWGPAYFNGPAPISITNLNLTGNLAGSGNVTLNGTCSWIDGYMEDTGTTTIANGATLNIMVSSSATAELQRTLVNNGTINWTEASTDTGETVNLAGAIQNNGTFDVTANPTGRLTFDNAHLGTSPSFSNTAGATLTLNGAGGLAFDSGVLLNNAGTVANNGPLFIGGGGNDTGVFSGAGPVTVSGGTAAVFTDTTFPSVTLNGGEADFDGTCSIGSLVQNGAIGGSGTLTIGTSTWTGGTMNGTGTTVLLAGATMNLLGVQNGEVSMARSFVNNGTVIWTENAGGTAETLDFGGSFQNNGNFTATTSGANCSLKVNHLNGTASFTNASGAKLTLDGAGKFTFNFGVSFNNDQGTVINNGPLFLYGGGTESGTFSGTGSFTIGGGTATFTNMAVPSLNLVGGEADFNGTSSVGFLNQTAGTLGGSGILIVNGISSWTSGTMNGTGTTMIASSATLNLMGIYNGAVTMSRTLINDGTINWTENSTDASETMPVAGAINNYGTFNITPHTGGTFYINIGSSGSPRFTNEAGSEFNFTGAGSAQFNIPFNNAGSVSLSNSGEMLNLYGGGSHTSGAFLLSAGTTLELAGTQTFGAGSTITGGGTVGLYSGLTTFNGMNLGGVLNLPAFGEVDFNGDSSVASLIQTGGTLGGSGNLTLNGTSTWTGGTMSGTGTTTIGNGATLNLQIGFSANITSRTLINDGTIDWTDNLGQGQQTINVAGPIDNYGTFNVAVQAGGSVMVTYLTSSRSFTNEIGGAFNLTGAGTTEFEIPFDNAGSVTLSSGKLALWGGGSESSGFTGQAGTTLEFGGTYTFTAAATVTGDLNVQVSGSADYPGNLITAGTVQFIYFGTWSIEGQFSASQLSCVDGGTLNLNGPSTTTLNMANATLGGSGNLTLDGTSTWTSGIMNGTGTTTIASGATLNLSGAHYTAANRTLVNGGTINWTEDSGNDSEFISVSGTIDNYGTFNAAAHSGGNLDFYNSGNFTNEIGGTFNSIAAGNTQFTVPFNNAGSVTISAGQLSLAGGGSQSSGFTGQPGATLEFNGKHTFTGAATITGNLNVQVDGGGADYPDDLTTTGTVQFNNGGWSLEGQLNASQLNVAGGSLVLNGASMSTLNQSGGTLNGSGALSLVGTSTWTGGTMVGPGVTTIANGATLNLLGISNGSVTAARMLINHGTVDWTELTGDSAENIYVGGGIQNFGTFDIVAHSGGALNFSRYIFGSSPSFLNESGGTFISSGSGNAQFNIPFNNAGIVAVSVGQLSLAAGGIQTSGITGQPGATLEFNGTHTFTPAATITGNVNVRVDGGAADYPDDLTTTGIVQFNNGTWSFQGQLDAAQLNLAGGTLTLNNDSTTTVNQTGGTLRDSSTINGSVNNFGGYIHPGSPTGALTINGNFTQSGTGQLEIELDGAASTGAFGQLVVNGTVSLGGSISVTCGYLPAHGDSFVVVSNDRSDSIGGTFSGLPEGSIVSVNGAYFRLSYVGGDGNDVSLTTINAPPVVSATGSIGAIFAGDSYTLNLAYTDGSADPNQSWSINWGDGTPVQVIAGNPTTATHTYADPSGALSYLIHAWATNSDGPFPAAPVAVAVYADPIRSNGVLTMTGTSGVDVVSISNANSLLSVRFNGAIRQYNSSFISGFVYNDGGGNDLINLSGSFLATLNLSTGNDSITNSGATAILYPGMGKISVGVSSGTTTLAAAGGSGIRQVQVSSIYISAGAKLVFANSSAMLGDYSSHANRTVVIVDAGGLHISTGGILDMGDNDLILHYAAGTQASTDALVSGLLASGFDGGAFDTAGINSSEASYDANFGSGTRALGWMDNNDIGANTFDGVNTSDLNEVMIKFTYYGDSDLSGTVDATDFGLFAAGKSNAGTGWAFGNYDYDSTTADATDFGLFAAGNSGYKQFGAL